MRTLFLLFVANGQYYIQSCMYIDGSRHIPCPVARRTKQEAQLTRHRLLDSAELLFQQRGVSGTSLHEIAQHAGLTRGAVYWHFTDKADLFNAMMERVTLPIEQALARTSKDGLADPLEHLRASLLEALRATVADARTRRVFEIATHKVEYVAELGAVRERHLAVRRACLRQMAYALRAAARARGVTLAMPAGAAAIAFHALVDGLIHNWMLAPDGFDLPRTGRKAIDGFLAGLGLADAAAAQRGTRASTSPGRPSPHSGR